MGWSRRKEKLDDREKSRTAAVCIERTFKVFKKEDVSAGRKKALVPHVEKRGGCRCGPCRSGYLTGGGVGKSWDRPKG